MRLKALLCVLGVLALVSPAIADQIEVGTISFDVKFGPDPQNESSGTNVFFALNLTGNPDFWSQPLTFTNVYLTLAPTSGPSVTYAVGTVGAGGSYETPMFSADTTFSSATFTGLAQESGWTLTGTLIPSLGPNLNPGDWAFIYADTGNPVAAPEPASLALLATGVGTLVARRRWLAR